MSQWGQVVMVIYVVVVQKDSASKSTWGHRSNSTWGRRSIEKLSCQVTLACGSIEKLSCQVTLACETYKQAIVTEPSVEKPLGSVGVRLGHASLCRGQFSKAVTVKWGKGTVSSQTCIKAGSVVKHHHSVVIFQMSGIAMVRSSTTRWRNGTGSKRISVQVQTWPVKNVMVL